MNRTEEREALYTAYSEKVRGYVFGKVANRHDAEDLVSDVFLKAYEKYPTFDADRASVSTWLYTITRNTVIDYFRTHRPGVELPEDLPDVEMELDRPFAFAISGADGLPLYVGAVNTME